MKKLIVSFLGVMLLVFGVSGAGATTLILTGARGDSGTINDAIFIVATEAMQETVSAGSGVIDPFLIIQEKGYEAGFNTDASAQPFDTKSSYSIQVDDLNEVEITADWYTSLGIDPLEEEGNYYEFLLDINESGSETGKYLTMQELEFYLNPLTGALEEAAYISPDFLGTLIWDLGEDNTVDLNYGLWAGSGQHIDLFVYIPTSLFGTNPNYFVYLYSAFGEVNPGDPSDAGFEEWCMRPGGVSIPEPGTMLLLGTGLIGLAGLGRKRFKRKEKLHT